MKKVYFLLMTIFIVWTPLAVFGNALESKGIPSAFFPETAYSFQPVVSGTQVSHTYIVQNKGSAVLEIQRVDTG